MARLACESLTTQRVGRPEVGGRLSLRQFIRSSQRLGEVQLEQVIAVVPLVQPTTVFTVRTVAERSSTLRR